MNDVRVVEHANPLRNRAIDRRVFSQGAQMVKVYAFEAYDPLRNEPVRAPCKMTVADIKSWRGVPIHGTEEEVTADKLDDNGRYYPED